MGLLSAWRSLGSNDGQRMAKDAAGRQPLPSFAIPSLMSSASRGSSLLDEGVEGRKARLAPAKAVNMFVSWMQRRGDVGITSSSRVLSLYSIHCIELDLAEVPPNVFLRELAAVAPRSSERVHRRDGARSRTRAYAIPAAVIPNNLSIARSAA